MVQDIDEESRGLPEIVDHPNSPLSAWKHYGILKVLERKFHEELEKQQYPGHLVGLDVTYVVGKDSYTMEYGYGVDGGPGVQPGKEPLSNEFVSEMYDLANNLVAQHISPYISRFDLLLSASINQQVNTIAVQCQIATQANCGKPSCIGKCRKFINRNNTGWVCQHKKGTCSCT